MWKEIRTTVSCVLPSRISPHFLCAVFDGSNLPSYSLTSRSPSIPNFLCSFPQRLETPPPPSLALFGMPQKIGQSFPLAPSYKTPGVLTGAFVASSYLHLLTWTSGIFSSVMRSFAISMTEPTATITPAAPTTTITMRTTKRALKGAKRPQRVPYLRLLWRIIRISK